MSELICYCWANGNIGFSKTRVPKGALPVATGDGIKWRGEIEVLCRLAYDNKTYIISEVRDAVLHGGDALEALRDFMTKLEKLGLKDPDTVLGQKIRKLAKSNQESLNKVRSSV